MIPFFVNSNIVVSQDDVSTCQNFMNAVAGNVGNSYITYSLMKELGVGVEGVRHIQNIYTYNFQNSERDLRVIRNECTHVILVLQDQIRVHESYGYRLPFYSLRKFLERVDKPIVCLGLGANCLNGFDPKFHLKLDKELVSFLSFLSERCHCIGVRGNFTQEVLEKLRIENTEVIGCPSYYENGHKRMVVKKNKITYDEIVATTPISPIKEIKAGKIRAIMQDRCEEFAIRACVYGEIGRLMRFSSWRIILNNPRIFASIPLWKSFLSTFKFAIGNRVHGAICALNSGVVPLCTSSDSRAMEMCEYLHIPHNNISTKTDIFYEYQRIDVDDINNNYRKLYEKYNRVFTKAFGQQISETEPLNEINFALPSCGWTVNEIMKRQIQVVLDRVLNVFG